MRVTMAALWGALIAVVATAAPASADWRQSIAGFDSPGYQGFPSSASSRSSERRAPRQARIVVEDDDEDARPRRRTRTARLTTSDSERPYRSGGASNGIASYYWQPQRVASGGWFNPNAMTAAHRTLPFGTKVQVTNVNNGRSVTVTINDRGPFIRGRVIDLSRAAAGVIGMQKAGLASVRLAVLGR